MSRWKRCSVLCFALGLALGSCGLPGLATAVFHPGPRTLSSLPADPGELLGFVTRDAARRENWPTGFLARVKSAISKSGGVVLVGRTDPVGPKDLNRTLALQYAVEAAHGLAAELSAELWRFACVGAGESRTEPPGVLAYTWDVAGPQRREPRRVAVLAPTRALPRSARVWAIWEAGARAVLWGLDGSGGKRVWELRARGEPVALPLPGRAARTAIGADFSGKPETVGLEPQDPVTDSRLTLRVEEVGPWAVRIMASVPDGYADAVLWCAGIPYAVAVAPGGVAVRVALLPEGNEAYLQAIGPGGRVAVGPIVQLPDGFGDPPDLLAVLVWDGRNVDLDLHAWAGDRHTHPQDPDAAFSSGAVPGTRLLFDGGTEARASALAAWGAPKLSLEVRCYSDFGRVGANALLFVAEHPGDPLTSRFRILGSRRLSERPLEARWPALQSGP